MHDKTLTELKAGLQAGDFSSRELTEHFLARIKQHDGKLNSFISVTEAQALQQADAADQAIAAGDHRLLTGLPIAHKDIFCTEGVRTSCGSRMLDNFIAPYTATAVEKMAQQGAVMLGKTNMDEFAMGSSNETSFYGPVKNPWDTERVPGGSSGGAAAALAAGLTPLELGSDIGGSIRTPAAFCGVCGLKPSFGLISTRGHVPGPPGALARRDISVAGPLARRVDDLELALNLLAAPEQEEAAAWRLDLPEPRHRTLKDFRVATWLDDSRCPVDRRIVDALESLTARVAERGASVDANARPHGVTLEDAHDLYYRLLTGTMGGGLPSGLYDQLQEAAGKADPQDRGYRALFARGATQSHAEWQRSDEQRAVMRAAWGRFFQDCDVLLCPGVQTLPFSHRQTPGPDQRTLTVNGVEQPYMDILVWVGLAGAVYLPAVTVPVGLTEDGLPLAVQIVGPYLEDRTVLAFAAELEALLEPLPEAPLAGSA